MQEEGFDICEYDKTDGDNSFPGKIQSSNVIFGATGDDIYDSVIGNLQPGTMLVSASSSDREFGGPKLREVHRGKIENCHQDLVFEDGTILLNCGFPLNFTGEENSVDPKNIQITRSLMVAAILFGVKNQELVRSRAREGNYALEQFVHESIGARFREIHRL